MGKREKERQADDTYEKIMVMKTESLAYKRGNRMCEPPS